MPGPLQIAAATLIGGVGLFYSGAGASYLLSARVESVPGAEHDFVPLDRGDRRLIGALASGFGLAALAGAALLLSAD